MDKTSVDHEQQAPSVDGKTATVGEAEREGYCDRCKPGRRWVLGSLFRDSVALCPLHAAAPDLYEALKLWVAETRFFTPDAPEYNAGLEKARAALALVTKDS